MQAANNDTITTCRYVDVPKEVLRDFKKVMGGYRTKKMFYEAAKQKGLTIYPSTVKNITLTKECEPHVLERVKEIIRVMG